MTMRLLMTTDAVGGVWTYALDLARGLGAHGVATTLAVLGPSPSPAAADAARCIGGLVLIDTGLPLDWLARDEADIAAAAGSIADLARDRGIEIVQLNAPSLAAFGYITQPVVGVCHSCVATWWSAVRGTQPDAEIQWRTRLLARGYAACDALVAPSASFAEMTATHYGMRPTVVHNGCDAAAGPTRRERFVLTAGRLWDDGKNVSVLDRAAALIDAPVFAAGPRTSPQGGTRELLHSQALGRLEAFELQQWMRRAAVFVSMSAYEPFGLSVLEAAMAGCALVLSDTPSYRELWEGAALFVPADEPALLAAMLQGVLDDPARAEGLGMASRRHAQRYGVAAMAAAMAGVYRRVMASGTAQRPLREAIGA